MHKILSLLSCALIAVGLTAAVACSTTDEPASESPTDTAGFNFTLNLSGYDPHDGQTLGVIVTADVGGAVVYSDSGTVAGGTFSSSSTDMPIVAGEGYTAFWFADLDGNGVCTPAEDSDGDGTADTFPDHMWSFWWGDSAADRVVDHTHDATFSDIPCDKF